MKELQKAIEFLVIHSMNADQVNQLGQTIDSKFSIHKISGFEINLPIPRQVAADAVIEYFTDEKDLVEFFSLVLENEGTFMHQSRMYARGKEKLLGILDRRDWIFDKDRKRFHKDQRRTTTTDWGFMREGEEYKLAFASVDIVGNSQLVRKNVRHDLDTTYSRLRQFIQKQIESRNGRIWFWHGDGGLAAFYDYKGIKQGLNAMMAILTYLPVFNVFENELKPEDEIRLRISLNFGRATYNSDLSRIMSEDLKKAENMEKYCAEPNSIVISDYIYGSIDSRLQKNFEAVQNQDYGRVFLCRQRKAV